MHIKYIWRAYRNKATYKEGKGDMSFEMLWNLDFWHKSYLFGGIEMQENSKMYPTLLKF
jgi:hypothetical protein